MVGRRVAVTAKPRAKPVSSSKRAGLTLPVGRIHKILREGNYSRRVGLDAAIYLSATLEYLVAEILELAAIAAQENNKAILTPRHVMLAIRNDVELDRMMQGVVICEGGVVPHIQPELLPRQKESKKSQADVSSQQY